MPGKLIWPSVDCWNVSVSESQSPLSCLGVRGKKQQGMSDRSTLHKSIVGPWELMGPLWAHRHTHSHTHTQTHWVIQSHLTRSTLTCCSNTDTQTHKYKHRLTHKHKRTKDNGARPTSWPPPQNWKLKVPLWVISGELRMEGDLLRNPWQKEDQCVDMFGPPLSSPAHIKQLNPSAGEKLILTPKLSQNRSKDVSEASSKRENHNPSHRLLFLFGV